MKITYIVIVILLIFGVFTAINTVDAKNIEISTNSSSSEINNFFNKGASLNGQKLAKGDTVIFQKGTYEKLSLKINKRINIKTKGSVVFDGDYSTKVAIRITTNNVKISGLKIQKYDSYGIVINKNKNKNKITKTAIYYCDGGISILGSNNRITNNKILSNDNNGILIKKGSKNKIDKNTINGNHLYGVYVSNSKSNKIINNNIKSNNDGITLYKAKMNTLNKNKLENNKWNALYIKSSSSNNKISQNKFLYNNCGIYSHGNSKNIIGRNTFIKNNIKTKNFY